MPFPRSCTLFSLRDGRNVILPDKEVVQLGRNEITGISDGLVYPTEASVKANFSSASVTIRVTRSNSVACDGQLLEKGKNYTMIDNCVLQLGRHPFRLRFEYPDAREGPNITLEDIDEFMEEIHGSGVPKVNIPGSDSPSSSSSTEELRKYLKTKTKKSLHHKKSNKKQKKSCHPPMKNIKGSKEDTSPVLLYNTKNNAEVVKNRSLQPVAQRHVEVLGGNHDVSQSSSTDIQVKKTINVEPVASTSGLQQSKHMSNSKKKSKVRKVNLGKFFNIRNLSKFLKIKKKPKPKEELGSHDMEKHSQKEKSECDSKEEHVPIEKNNRILNVVSTSVATAYRECDIKEEYAPNEENNTILNAVSTSEASTNTECDIKEEHISKKENNTILNVASTSEASTNTQCDFKEEHTPKEENNTTLNVASTSEASTNTECDIKGEYAPNEEYNRTLNVASTTDASTNMKCDIKEEHARNEEKNTTLNFSSTLVASTNREYNIKEEYISDEESNTILQVASTFEASTDRTCHIKKEHPLKQENDTILNVASTSAGNIKRECGYKGEDELKGDTSEYHLKSDESSESDEDSSEDEEEFQGVIKDIKDLNLTSYYNNIQTFLETNDVKNMTNAPKQEHVCMEPADEIQVSTSMQEISENRVMTFESIGNACTSLHQNGFCSDNLSTAMDPKPSTSFQGNVHQEASAAYMLTSNDTIPKNIISDLISKSIPSSPLKQVESVVEDRRHSTAINDSCLEIRVTDSSSIVVTTTHADSPLEFMNDSEKSQIVLINVENDGKVHYKNTDGSELYTNGAEQFVLLYSVRNNIPLHLREVHLGVLVNQSQNRQSHSNQHRNCVNSCTEPIHVAALHSLNLLKEGRLGDCACEVCRNVLFIIQSKLDTKKVDTVFKHRNVYTNSKLPSVLEQERNFGGRVFIVAPAHVNNTVDSHEESEDNRETPSHMPLHQENGTWNTFPTLEPQSNTNSSLVQESNYVVTSTSITRNVSSHSDVSNNSEVFFPHPTHQQNSNDNFFNTLEAGNECTDANTSSTMDRIFSSLIPASAPVNDSVSNEIMPFKVPTTPAPRTPRNSRKPRRPHMSPMPLVPHIPPTPGMSRLPPMIPAPPMPLIAPALRIPSVVPAPDLRPITSRPPTGPIPPMMLMSPIASVSSTESMTPMQSVPPVRPDLLVPPIPPTLHQLRNLFNTVGNQERHLFTIQCGKDNCFCASGTPLQGTVSDYVVPNAGMRFSHHPEIVQQPFSHQRNENFDSFLASLPHWESAFVNQYSMERRTSALTSQPSSNIEGHHFSVDSILSSGDSSSSISTSSAGSAPPYCNPSPHLSVPNYTFSNVSVGNSNWEERSSTPVADRDSVPSVSRIQQRKQYYNKRKLKPEPSSLKNANKKIRSTDSNDHLHHQCISSGSNFLKSKVTEEERNALERYAKAVHKYPETVSVKPVYTGLNLCIRDHVNNVASEVFNSTFQTRHDLEGSTSEPSAPRIRVKDYASLFPCSDIEEKIINEEQESSEEPSVSRKGKWNKKYLKKRSRNPESFSNGKEETNE